MLIARHSCIIDGKHGWKSKAKNKTFMRYIIHTLIIVFSVISQMIQLNVSGKFSQHITKTWDLNSTFLRKWITKFCTSAYITELHLQSAIHDTIVIIPKSEVLSSLKCAFTCTSIGCSLSTNSSHTGQMLTLSFSMTFEAPSINNCWQKLKLLNSPVTFALYSLIARDIR